MDSTLKDKDGVFSHFHPMTRRLSATLRSTDIQHTRARSQSNESMLTLNKDDYNYNNGILFCVIFFNNKFFRYIY